MTIKNLNTIEAFLQGNQPVALSVLGNKTERYNFIRKTLVKISYMTRTKKDKGIVIRYLLKMTGYSRQQLARLMIMPLRSSVSAHIRCLMIKPM